MAYGTPKSKPKAGMFDTLSNTGVKVFQYTSFRPPIWGYKAAKSVTKKK